MRDFVRYVTRKPVLCVRLPGFFFTLVPSVLEGFVAGALAHFLVCLVWYTLVRLELTYERREAEREQYARRLQQILFGTPGVIEDGTVIDLFLATRRLKRKRVGLV